MKPRLIIKRRKKTHLPERTKDVILEEAWTYLVHDTSKDVHLQEGVLSKEDLTKPSGSLITSSLGKEFVILDPSFVDLFQRLRKAPQTIPLKDLGWILAQTGISKESIVIDLGGGSGAVAAFLAHLCKKVNCYEISEERCTLIRENLKMMSLENASVICQDVIKTPPKEKGDIIIIDLPTPWLLGPHLGDLVQIGGYIVNYSPPIISAQKFVRALSQDSRFQVITTIELIERPWKIEGDAVRPATTKIGHSGFLTLARRIC